jgi:hypothetical protein
MNSVDQPGVKRWQYRTLTGLLLAGVTLAVLWIAGSILKRHLQPLILKTLNEKLAAPVMAEHMQISLLRHFPSAAFVLKNVTVMPLFKERYDTLLAARSVAILFRWKEIFSKSVSIRKIEMKDGRINLHIRKDGKENFRIWKEDTSSTSHQLDLNHIHLHQVVFNYVDDRNDHSVSSRLAKADIRALLASPMKITVRARLEQPRLSVNKMKLLNGQLTLLSFSMDYDKSTGNYFFHPSEINVAGLKLKLQGRIQDKKEFTEYDLKIQSGDGDLARLLALIPPQYSQRWKDYKIKGRAALSMTIQGKDKGPVKPLCHIVFSIHQGGIKTSSPPVTLSAIQLQGEYISQDVKHKTDRLILSAFTASLQGHNIKGTLEIQNLSDPFLTLNLDATFMLEDMARFYLPPLLENISGEMMVKKGTFHGKLNDAKTHRASGELSLQDVTLSFRQHPVIIRQLEGSLMLNNENLTVHHLAGNTRTSDFTFAGHFNNLVGYLWNRTPLFMKGALQSSFLNFDEILARESHSTRDTVYKIELASNVSFQLKLNVEKTRFRRFSAENIEGLISLHEQTFRASRLSMSTMQGQAILSGFITVTATDSLQIGLDASLKSINIKEMFYQLGNFGQRVITDQHLQGEVTAEMSMYSQWSKQLICHTPSVTAQASLTIENGELNEFEPMKALARYLKGSDLNRIRFSTLKNTIEIRHRQVFIPQMDIQSSAADLTLAGSHSFDNVIDYRIQLLLSQVLGRKVKSYQTEFGEIEEDQHGRTKLMLRLTGPATNPKIHYDTQAVKEKIASEIKKETQTVKQLLQEEFGKNKTQESQPVVKRQAELEIEED